MPTTCQVLGKPSQSWQDSHIQFAAGRNTGFVESGSGPVAMGYWQEANQPLYSIASQFPIADRYFCSILGPTFPNRRYLISATSLGMIDDTIPAFTAYPPNGTIFDRLDDAGSDANANAMLDMLDLQQPAFLKPPALARSLLDSDPLGALACEVLGPGTIPPPGSVSSPPR